MTAPNGRGVVSEAVDRRHASSAFRYFYEAFFETLIAARSEVDWDLVRKLSTDELALARRLIRANLHGPQEYRDAAGVLNDRDSIPLLHDMLQEASSLSERINIARPLWFLERAPVFADLVEQLVQSQHSELKLQHIWDILLLADERALDHLFTMAEDRDEAVRDAALHELTRLATGRDPASWIRGRERVRDLEYLRSRRLNPKALGRMTRNLVRDHAAQALFDP